MSEQGTNVQTTGQRPNRTNGAASRPESPLIAVPEPEAEPATAGDDVPPPLGSRFGPLGAFVKTVIFRLLRFYTHRQEAINEDLGERVRLLETATRRELAAMHRDVTDAAVDFGAIADRMRVLENVRRIVERSGPYRYEVRVHRRELVELRRQMAVVSARLTLVQRETAPLRSTNALLSERLNTLDELAARLVRDLHELNESTVGLARHVEHAQAQGSALAAIVEDRTTELDRNVQHRLGQLTLILEERAAGIDAGLQQSVSDLARTIEERAAAIDYGVQQNVSDVARTIEERAGEIARTVEERVDGIDAGLQQSVSDLARTIEERAAAIDGGVQQNVSDLTRTLEERAGEIARTVEERAGGIERGIQQRVGEIAQTVEERASEVDRASRQRAAAFERLLEERTAQLDHDSVQRAAQIERAIEQRAVDAQRNADHRTSELERTIEQRFETIGSALAETRATASGGLSSLEREQHAVAATLRSEIGLLRRAIRDLEPLARPRDLDALRNQLEVLALRLSDVVGTLNSVREESPQHVETQLAPVREIIAAQHAQLEAHRTELDALAGAPALAARVAEVADRLAAADRDVAELRSRLLATPYMSVPMESWPIPRVSTADNFDYVAFEDVFRGPEAFIRERLRVYLPLLDGCTNVVELGCGRGEFLQLMRERKIAATGVDINADAVARARSKRLKNVVHGDAVAYLAGRGERSVGAVFSAQFAEHLPFEELLRCLELARTRLVPGGVFIAETVNPNSIEGSKTFFVDPSHVKPLFPEVFAFLCRSMGFERVRLFYPNGAGFDETSPTSQHEYAVVATAPG